ncbi:MAG: CDP-glycerol glycerophosphotransferase family protein [Christensenellales bacterium]|jgi:CDP-glycerol glycerophosphotransferase (TagB/SpsB family)
MEKLNITFCSYPDFGGNAKALYEYMKKRYKDQMNLVWIVYNDESVMNLKKIGTKAILIGSDEFKEYIPKTDVFFTTQGNLDGDKLKAKNSIYIELWHGIGPKPIGFACDNPSKEDLKGYKNISQIVDLFIVPNDFWRVVYSSIFNVEMNRIKSLGMPILDYFKYSNGYNNLEKVLNKSLNKYKKIIMYMPTFKNGFNHNDITIDNGNIFNFKENFEINHLNEYLKSNNYLLCVKKHPGDTKKLEFDNLSNIINIKEEQLLNNNISINEVINAFDLLITDYSSIGTEFIFIDKPVLFITSDLDEYINNRGIIFGSHEFWMGYGPKVNNIKVLYNEIYNLLENDSYFKKEREAYRNLFFGNLDDGGCKNICDYIFDNGSIRKNFKRYNSEIFKLNDKIEELNVVLREKDEIIDARNARIRELDQFISNIINSKGWKILEKVRKIIYKKNKEKK